MNVLVLIKLETGKAPACAPYLDDLPREELERRAYAIPENFDPEEERRRAQQGGCCGSPSE